MEPLDAKSAGLDLDGTYLHWQVIVYSLIRATLLATQVRHMDVSFAM